MKRTQWRGKTNGEEKIKRMINLALRTRAKISQMKDQGMVDQPLYTPRCAKLLQKIEQIVSQPFFDYGVKCSIQIGAEVLATNDNYAGLKNLLTNCMNAFPKKKVSNKAGISCACDSTGSGTALFETCETRLNQ